MEVMIRSIVPEKVMSVDSPHGELYCGSHSLIAGT